MLLSYLLFVAAGLAFGYAAPRAFKLTPLVFPLLLALLAVVQGSFDGEGLVRLVAALIVTTVGIVLGWLLDAGVARRGASTA
jgi:hypothetical protein